MKKILLTIFFLVLFNASVYAACGGTCFAKTAGGNWSAAATWSATSSGGVDSVGPPAATDNVIFELLSGPVTIDAASVARSVNMTSGTGLYTGTLTHNAFTLTIGDATAGAGNVALKFSSGMTYALTDVINSAITFVSTSSTQQTIDYGGKNAGNITFTGANQNYAVISNITMNATATITYTGGSSSQIHFDGVTNNSGLTHLIGLFSSNNSNTSTIAWGNANVTFTGGVATVVNMSTSLNRIVTQGASGSINTSGNASTINVGGANCVYTNIILNIGSGTETNGGTYVFINGNGFTVANLTVTNTGGPDDRFGVGGPFTITSTFTINGTPSAIHRISMLPTSQANVKILTVSGAAISFSYVDIQDFAFISTTNVDFSSVTGNGAIGDAGGNSISGGGLLIFLSPTTQHATGTTSFNWSDITRWTSRIPLAQDNVIFDNAFSAGQTVTADRKWLCHNLDFTGGTGNVTLQGSGVTSSEVYTTGSITWRSGMTWAGNSSLWQLNARGPVTYTDNGVTKSNISKITIQAGNGGTFNFSDNANMGTFRLYGGTVNFNNANLSFSTIEIGTNNAGNATIWNQGSGTITLSSTGNILFPTIDVATNYANLTVNAQTSTIAITNTSASSKTFEGGGKTFGNIVVTGGGAGAVIFKSANTFNHISVVGGTKNITLPGSTTTTILSGTGLGNGTNIVTFVASAGSATISVASGIVSWNYVNLTNIIGTGGATFYAGGNSINGGGNTGWSFTNAPTQKAKDSSVMGLSISIGIP